MLKFTIGSVQLLIERRFIGIAVGRRSLWWSQLDGWNVERLQKGVSAF